VEEFQRAADSGKFNDLRAEKIVLYPDGSPGFYFVRLRYSANADALFAVDRETRQAIQQETVKVGGEDLVVHYSALDMGPIGNLFDGDTNTLIRTAAANPLRLQIDFPTVKRMDAIALRIGGTASTLDVYVQVPGEDSARTYHLEVDEDPLPRTVTVHFGVPLEASNIFIKLKNTYDPEPGHVHLWEITWK